MSKRQEAFNKIVATMAAQNWERSMSPSGSSCKYRGARGLKCAIGVLLNDTDANVCDELRCGAHNLPTTIEDRLVSETGFTINDLALIQRAHDRGNTGTSMRTLFIDVAHNLGLEFIEHIQETDRATADEILRIGADYLERTHPAGGLLKEMHLIDAIAIHAPKSVNDDIVGAFRVLHNHVGAPVAKWATGRTAAEVVDAMRKAVES